jgi:two-component system, OmpR family, response regulator
MGVSMQEAVQFNLPYLDNASIRLLVIGRDHPQPSMAQTYLQEHGMMVGWATDASSGLEAAIRSGPDVVLIDPGSLGLGTAELCLLIRARCALPVIALVCPVDDSERVLALESGADDCLSKPICLRELLARVRAQVRRARGRVAGEQRALEIGALRIEPLSMQATLAGRLLNLTTYEFRLLQVLAERAGRVLSREQLINLVRGSADEAFDRSVDSHVSRLRHKLGDNPRDPRILKTVRGGGYLFAGAQSTCDAQ